MHISIKRFFSKSSFLRFLALYRDQGGTLGQLGWKRIYMDRFLVSGRDAVPWIVYGAIDFLEHQVAPEASVLELGGGASTAFWLERGNNVTMVETDPQWFKKIMSAYGENPRLTGYLLEDITPDQLDKLQLGTFDVIVNDFNGSSRQIVANWILNHLNPDSYVVWDNSDRLAYSSGLEKLRNAGLGHVSFFGLAPINSYASETTVF